MKQKLTQEKLKEALHYDPVTGIFTWIRNRIGHKAGTQAGYLNPAGYRSICINYRSYQASHLANLYMEGYLPEYEMDHRNRVRWGDSW
jgi:hypothetical protein